MIECKNIIYVANFHFLVSCSHFQGHKSTLTILKEVLEAHGLIILKTWRKIMLMKFLNINYCPRSVKKPRLSTFLPLEIIIQSIISLSFCKLIAILVVNLMVLNARLQKELTLSQM